MQSAFGIEHGDIEKGFSETFRAAAKASKGAHRGKLKGKSFKQGARPLGMHERIPTATRVNVRAEGRRRNGPTQWGQR